MGAVVRRAEGRGRRCAGCRGQGARRAGPVPPPGSVPPNRTARSVRAVARPAGRPPGARPGAARSRPGALVTGHAAFPGSGRRGTGPAGRRGAARGRWHRPVPAGGAVHHAVSRTAGVTVPRRFRAAVRAECRGLTHECRENVMGSSQSSVRRPPRSRRATPGDAERPGARRGDGRVARRVTRHRRQPFRRRPVRWRGPGLKVTARGSRRGGPPDVRHTPLLEGDGSSWHRRRAARPT